ncbi:MAG: U32 family peptidase [Candidatus Jordarchaeales archaeon]
MRPKILAPAGEWKSFLAAVECGADVVYLGGKSFNARQYAENFTLDEIKNAVRYAHKRGVEVYVTVNTLVFDEELEAVAHYLGELHEMGVDAVIFQDLAVLEMGKSLHGLKLIASTQTTTHSLEAVRFFERLGAHGVILARELTLEEIRRIRTGTGLWLEAFVHGALCFSYSGACLMSSLIGGRSGNRGRCAQPCRKRYKLIDTSGKTLAEGHLLSTRDLCLVNRLRDLVEAGVDGFKIEGRMRRPEYVAVTVDVYKHALKGALENRKPGKRAVERLASVFSRSFTEGYIDGDPGVGMMNYERPDNVGVKVGQVTGHRRGMLEVRLLKELRVGDGLEIITEKNKMGFIVSEMYSEGRRVKRASVGAVVSIPFSGEAHVGCPVYRTRDVRVVRWVEGILQKAEDKVACIVAGCGSQQPIGRSALSEGVAKSRLEDGDEYCSYHLSTQGDTGQLSVCSDSTLHNVSLTLSVSVGELESLKRAVDCGADRIVIGGDYFKPNRPLSFDALSEGADYCREHGVEFMLSTPRIARSREIALLFSSMENIASLRPNGVLAGNYGTLNLLLEAKVAPVYVDYFLNVTNSISLHALNRLGVRGVALSPELTLKQISLIHKKGLEVECVAHGPLELMVSEHCVARSVLCPEGKCSAPCFRSSFYLEDERGFRFPVMFDQNCRMHLFNSRDLCMIDSLDRLAEAGVKVARLDCRAKNPSYVEEVVRAYRSVLDGSSALLFKKTLRELAPITRGHFFRGVT